MFFYVGRLCHVLHTLSLSDFIVRTICEFLLGKDQPPAGLLVCAGRARRKRKRWAI